MFQSKMYHDTGRIDSSNILDSLQKFKSGGGGGSYFPNILLNEIQTMFSQLTKRSARVLPADLCTDPAHYVKKHASTVFRKKQKHGSRRGDCFSLLYFGNSQIY